MYEYCRRDAEGIGPGCLDSVAHVTSCRRVTASQHLYWRLQPAKLCACIWLACHMGRLLVCHVPPTIRLEQELQLAAADPCVNFQLMMHRWCQMVIILQLPPTVKVLSDGDDSSTAANCESVDAQNARCNMPGNLNSSDSVVLFGSLAFCIGFLAAGCSALNGDGMCIETAKNTNFCRLVRRPLYHQRNAAAPTH